MNRIISLTEEEMTQVLTYSGLVLLAFELIKSLIVNPIKLFYTDMTFGEGMPFKSYDHDVRSRHKSEFESCLLYLRDFMAVIDQEDMNAIQELRQHRNDLAHDLVNRLHSLKINSHALLLERANKALFKLSNHKTYMDIGADPEFQNKGIDWDTVEGHEYILLKEVLHKIRILSS